MIKTSKYSNWNDWVFRLLPDVKRTKNISLGDVLGKCTCLSFCALSVNGYAAAAVETKFKHM